MSGSVVRVLAVSTSVGCVGAAFGQAGLEVAYNGVIDFSIDPMVQVGDPFDITAMIDPSIPDSDPDPLQGVFIDPWMWHWVVWDWLFTFEIDVIPIPDPDPRVVINAVFGDDDEGASPIGTTFVTTFNFQPDALVNDSLKDVQWDTQFLNGQSPSRFEVFDPAGNLVVSGTVENLVPAPGVCLLYVAAGALAMRRRR